MTDSDTLPPMFLDPAAYREALVRMKAAEARADEAESRLAHAEAVLSGEPMLVDMGLTGDGMHIGVQHWAVRAMAASFMQSLGEAPNYIEVEVIADKVDPPQKLIVTIQRANGKRPAVIAREAREERDELAAECAGLRQNLAELAGQLEAAERGLDEKHATLVRVADEKRRLVDELEACDRAVARVHQFGVLDGWQVDEKDRAVVRESIDEVRGIVRRLRVEKTQQGLAAPPGMQECIAKRLGFGESPPCMYCNGSRVTGQLDARGEPTSCAACKDTGIESDLHALLGELTATANMWERGDDEDHVAALRELVRRFYRTDLAEALCYCSRPPSPHEYIESACTFDGRKQR